MDNIILCADSYKVTHHLQYPPGTKEIYSYFESRGGKFDKVLFFGLQYIIKKWLVGKVVTEEKIALAKSIFKAHFGKDLFNEEGWRYILEKHGGRLPVKIKAVPEGSLIPYRNVLFTIQNTDPECFWLTNYLETLLVQTWYPMTVATNSFYQKKILHKHLSATSETLVKLPFQLHDFGFRGCSTVESAMIGGLAHLVNFRGTDTIAALVGGMTYYRSEVAGFSIPAAEHSTITSWGRDGEEQAFKNMLDRFPDGPVSVVSDSYNVYEACQQVWGEKLKVEVMKRGKENFLVIRPDSGDPTSTVLKVLNILEEKFGTSINSKGFKLLPDCVRVIQGDGISYDSLDEILRTISAAGWSTENLTFGSGGALLQRLDRDTQKCAFKSSFAVIGDKKVSIYKDPVDDKVKKSKKGKLRLSEKDGTFCTIEESDLHDDQDDVLCDEDVLKTIFENGKLLKDFSLDEVRQLSDSYFLREVE